MVKKSKTYNKVSKHAKTILEGTMLAIDPSTGSRSSMPGYAWYKKGKLIESGIFEINPGWSRHKRLYEIGHTLREEFEMPDILAIEYIAMVKFQGGISQAAIGALQKAIGAIYAARPWPAVVEIPTSAWRHHKPEEYIKTDEWDAITIGLYCVNISKEVLKNG